MAGVSKYKKKKNPEAVRIGENIRNIRTSKGITQEQLAQILKKPGCDSTSRYNWAQGYLSALERGVYYPSDSTIKRLADALGVNPSKIKNNYSGPIDTSVVCDDFNCDTEKFVRHILKEVYTVYSNGMISDRNRQRFQNLGDVLQALDVFREYIFRDSFIQFLVNLSVDVKPKKYANSQHAMSDNEDEEDSSDGDSEYDEYAELYNDFKRKKEEDDGELPFDFTEIK